MPQQEFMQVFPFWDVNYRQHGDGGFRKPNRLYGSGHILALTPALCDGVHCKMSTQGEKYLRPLEGPMWVGIKKAELWRLHQVCCVWKNRW